MSPLICRPVGAARPERAGVPQHRQRAGAAAARPVRADGTDGAQPSQLRRTPRRRPGGTTLAHVLLTARLYAASGAHLLQQCTDPTASMRPQHLTSGSQYTCSTAPYWLCLHIALEVASTVWSQALARLPQLACLDLSGCNHLTGAALAPIGTVTSLQTLKLQHCLRCQPIGCPFGLPIMLFSVLRSCVSSVIGCLLKAQRYAVVKLWYHQMSFSQTALVRLHSMGAADLAELRALQDLASLSLRGCPSLAAAGVSSLAALTALRCFSQLCRNRRPRTSSNLLMLTSYCGCKDCNAKSLRAFADAPAVRCAGR